MRKGGLGGDLPATQRPVSTLDFLAVSACTLNSPSWTDLMTENPAAKRVRPVAPSALHGAGRALWNAVHKDLPERLDLDEVELLVLTDACLLRDRAATLAARVRRDGVMLSSSQGERANPLLAEERQLRMASRRLVASIDMTGRPARAAHRSERAAKAATARWARGA